MELKQNRNIQYFSINDTDEAWGIVVTTVGYQLIAPDMVYPKPLQHPDSHSFNPKDGRILKEYQLVYISQGEGYFESESCPKTRIKSGTMILLYPNEWHTYQPDPATGWYEYWVGFRGPHIDRRIENGFFNKFQPVYNIGISSTIINQYEEIVNYSLEEKSGYQQLISSIVLMILGTVYYKSKNAAFTNTSAINKINDARNLMKNNIETHLSPVEIATSLGVSYSWFRQMFKKYTGLSPTQYQLQLKHQRSKEYLERSGMSVSEIAYKLGFESISQFCNFFRKKEGVSPSRYRKGVNSFGNKKN